MKGKNGISSTMKNLKSAIVVVTDNERYSVALCWCLDCDCQAPKVVMKGSRTEFRYINDSAKQNFIDLFESPFLACMLYVSTEVGQEISQEHCYAVALVISFVLNSRYGRNYQLKKPKPDKYLLHNMGLDMKKAVPN